MITKNLLYGFALIVAVGGFSAVAAAGLHLFLKSDRDFSAERTLLLAKLKSRLTVVVIVVAVIVSLAVLFEIGLRLFTRPDSPPGYTVKHPTRGHALRPGYRGYTYDAPLEINDRGIRDRERDVEFGEDALRVVVLGDAMTYGIGVPLEQTYPSVIEARLERQRRKTTQVFNLGVPDYNTVDEALLLEEMFEVYQPHLVILQFEMLGNDVVFKPRPEPQTGFRSSPLWQQLREIPGRSYALTWTTDRIYQVRFSLRRQSTSLDPLEKLRKSIAHRLEGEYAEGAIGWSAAQQAATQINNFLADRGVPFVFAISVNYTDMSEDAQQILQPLTDHVAGTIESLGISPVLIIDEAFAGYAGREPELFLGPDDDHWTVLGHSLVAEYLLSHLASDPQLSALIRSGE